MDWIDGEWRSVPPPAAAAAAPEAAAAAPEAAAAAPEAAPSPAEAEAEAEAEPEPEVDETAELERQLAVLRAVPGTSAANTYKKNTIILHK